MTLRKIQIPLFFLFPAFIIFIRLAPSYSLLLGLVLGLLFENPYPKKTKPVTKYLLQGAVVGLGFGMNFGKVMEAGKSGFIFTLVTIVAALGVGYLLGRFLRVERTISYLISVGTAICGGSAIAAVSQVLKSDENDIAISIGTVFILNAIALFIFPPIGTYFHLSQEQFGIWCAIAIHDTSSVVGAASRYGNEALMTAVTVKLARTLWIVPLVLLTSFLFRKKSSRSSFPWFILFFVFASLINTYSHLPLSISTGIVGVSKVGFSITLYLIGTGISVDAIRKVGVRPMLQGVLLWAFIMVVSFYALPIFLA